MALQPFSIAATATANARSAHSRIFSPLPSRTDPYQRRENLFGHLCVNANVLGSTASYARLQEGAGAFSSWSLVTDHIVKKRAGVVRFATLDEIEVEKFLIEKHVEEQMKEIIVTFLSKSNEVTTQRADPSMLDRVEVEHHGTPVSLKSIAQISTPDGSSLLVQPYDKSSLEVIEKAIVNSDLGLTPNNDGEIIRLSIPQLTSERRKELLKEVYTLAREGAVAIRKICRNVIKAYKEHEKEKKCAEDDVKDLSSSLKLLTFVYINKIKHIYKQKYKEVLCSSS